jgi:Kef-type K+ transport system membrane component KefB
MNARGLMELVVIRIGLDVGVIGEALFTMLFVTAMLTTALTGPTLFLFSRRETVHQADAPFWRNRSKQPRPLHAATRVSRLTIHHGEFSAADGATTD